MTEAVAATVSLADEAAGLTGSAVVLDGTSGSGKTFLACRIALANAFATGGAVMAYDPTGHVEQNLRSQEVHYVKALDTARREKSREAIDDAIARLSLFRDDGRMAFYGVGEEESFALTLRGIVSSRRTVPFGVVLIDEGGFARNDKNAREHLESAMRGAVPLARNARVLVVLSGHRLMAAVPEIRAVMRYRVMWNNPDPTANDDLANMAEEKGWQVYSDAMGMPGKEGQRRFYRGIKFGDTASRARPFQLGRDEKLPRWMYLPAVMSEAPKDALKL